MKLFLSEKICLKDKIVPGGILVENGRISKILSSDNLRQYKVDPDVQVFDFGNNVLMAGIVDSHVHVNEPGRTDWEGYFTATQAAAAGGITTIVDMPLNSIPPTTTLENLEIKRNSAKEQLFVDVAFWGGLISGNQNELLKLIDAGVVGFKCFMCPSGVDEFPFVQKQDIEDAINVLENTDATLAFHAEIDENIHVKDDPTKFSTFLKTRPAEMEIEAISTILELCTNRKVKSHIVHLSTAEALPLIEHARKIGCDLTVETCHHYLTLDAEDVPDKATQFKCCPPIRDIENREKLWKGLEAGIIDLVVSDHSPCTPDLKCLDTGNFLKAWGGISSLQFGLSLFWTEARKRGFNVWDIGKFLSAAPAKLCGLHTTKGELKERMDADFVIWDPESQFEINTSMIFHKNKVTPYLGKILYGKVTATVVRGHIVYENGNHSESRHGILLKKKIKV